MIWVACVGTMLCWASFALHWSCDGWPCFFLGTLAGELALPIRENSPLYLRKMALTIGMYLTWKVQESWPYGWGYRWSDSENMRAGELTPLICHVMAWVRKRCPCPSALSSRGNWESWPQCMRVRHLAMSHISCSTQKSGSCTPPGKYIRADPVVRGIGKPGLSAWG